MRLTAVDNRRQHGRRYDGRFAPEWRILTLMIASACLGLAADFNVRENSMGVWSYGRGALPGDFEAFVPRVLPNGRVWQRQVEYPYIRLYESAGVQNGGTITSQDVVVLEPAVQTDPKPYAMVRFKPPVDGVYTFDGRLETASLMYAGTRQVIVLNGREVLFENRFGKGHGQSRTFHLTRRLRVGDFVLFGVSPSPNGDNSSDGTGLAVVVTEANADLTWIWVVRGIAFVGLGLLGIRGRSRSGRPPQGTALPHG